MTVLGAIIAGGGSTRYGAPKLLAEVGGQRIVDRVVTALAEAVAETVAIVNDAGIAARIDLAARADTRPDGGAVAGLLTALLWARERGDDAIVAVGSDMPFVSPTLLRALVDRLAAGDADAVLPESDGPRGVEPLCAAYSTRCIGAIERALDEGDRRMIGFHSAIRIVRLPLDAVRTHGDPARLFFNVNTPTDRLLAERLAATGP